MLRAALAGVIVAVHQGNALTVFPQLLVALGSEPGRVLSRRQLIDHVWGWDFFGDERVVDVHIRNLRKALGDDASDPRFIATVRGVGYKAVG